MADIRRCRRQCPEGRGVSPQRISACYMTERSEARKPQASEESLSKSTFFHCSIISSFVPLSQSRVNEDRFGDILSIIFVVFRFLHTLLLSPDFLSSFLQFLLSFFHTLLSFSHSLLFSSRFLLFFSHSLLSCLYILLSFLHGYLLYLYSNNSFCIFYRFHKDMVYFYPYCFSSF